ncbi:MAG: hypothetical protein M1818_005048 [Claussenomyces sp. TS43310]|nr:MAG: hypothetical protein M1818_005048 [Claussenomyces sp. TS43310]
MAASASSVVTIDNFESKMSKYDPHASSLFGLVDMGSNGIRFSISDLSHPSARLLHCVHRERVGISLYDALHESTPDAKPFCFSPHTILTVAETLARFRSICDGYGVPPSRISVFATEAMRTAHNRDEMLGAIKACSGLEVELLSPGMESLFGAMGARSGFVDVDGLFMDLGGGSVQMTYVNSKDAGYDVLAAKAAQSMPFGAAKLHAALNIKTQASSTVHDLKTTMKTTFEDMKSQFPALKKQAESSDGITIYFCGGGFRGYGSMLMHTSPIRPYPIPTIGGFKASGHQFMQWKSMLKANDKEGKIFGMSKRRRQQFPAIATVVEALVDAIPHIREVIFCSGGNREGILYMKLPAEIRDSNPLTLLPSSSDNSHPTASIDTIVNTLQTALPTPSPPTLTPELLHYIARNTWLSMGEADDVNSAKALHNPISGSVAALPGLTHDLRAMLALSLCARWGADLSPIDGLLYQNLQQLLGPQLSFWCQYLGALARFLGVIFPTFPVNAQDFQGSLAFKASLATHLGKKGKRSGILLGIQLQPDLCRGIEVDKMLGVFKAVGKDLDIDMRVEAKLV